MAQFVESMAVIKISRLVKDGQAIAAGADDAVFDQLEAVLEEILGDPRIMVEIIKPDE